MIRKCVFALVALVNLCAALIPHGNTTFEEATVNVWGEWAEDVAADYVLPGVEAAAAWVWENYWLVAGAIAGLWLFRWNQSSLIFEGGWQGTGRQHIRKELAPDMLPPYPNGWYKILDSKDLTPGKVKSVQVCGKQLVAFRTKEGKLGILDAYCPHLGANLAVHGKVVDNCVVCPFHAWRFNTEGDCEGIEYSDSIPKGSNITSYPSFEALNLIYVWYDVECREPAWFPVEDENVASGKWKHLAWSGHEILSHICEIPENGADSAHLNVVHKAFVFTNREIPEEKSFFEHEWKASWEADREQPWVANLTVDLRHMMGTDFLNSLGDVHVEAKQVGPSLVYLRITTFFGEMLMAQSVTPIGPMRQRVEHNFFVSPGVPRWFGKMMAWGSCRQFHRDIDMWEHKMWRSRPLLTKGDGPIQKYRAWFKKFYSENSIPFVAPQAGSATW